MKRVVYTAIFGDKDDLSPITQSRGFDYKVFTDNPDLVSNDHEVVVCDSLHDDPTRAAKIYKVLAHDHLADYDCSLWVDGSVDVVTDDLVELFDRYLADHDLALHHHTVRSCAYAEASACIKLEKDNPEVIREQMYGYLAEGFPKRIGLPSGGIIFRRHTEAIAKLNRDWWSEIQAHSRRDQLSLSYVIWKNDLPYHVIPGHLRDDDVEGFEKRSHKNPESFRNW